MKAVVQTEYGSPEVLEVRDIEKPRVKDDEVPQNEGDRLREVRDA